MSFFSGKKDFFSGKKDKKTAEFMRDRRPQETEIILSDADREAAARKLLALGPTKDKGATVKSVVKGMKRAMGVPIPPADVPDYKKVKALRSTDIAYLCQNLANIESQLREYGEQKADTRGEIQLLVELAGVRSVMVDKWLVTRTEGSKPRETIVRQKLVRQLMKRGFSADDAAVVINLSTKKGKPGAPALYVTDTTKPRGKKGGGVPWQG